MDVGLDRLPLDTRLQARLRSGRFGLLAHPASVDRKLVHIADVLAGCDLTPHRIFGPEHGYGGEAQDMIGVGDAVDARSGAPIVSLYGERFRDLSPRPEHLDGLSVLLVDLADVGSRYYTFVWTALLALRAAARAGVHVVILDRPNPLGGVVVEGATVETGFASFVGLEAIPIRHGMTPGSLVAHFAHADGLDLGPDGALSIVGVRDLPDAALAPAWDRPFVMTSPNMPSFETALVYPGGCLLEGTNLSEGRGTTRPFEIVGAPFVDGTRLARELTDTGLGGFVARPLTFQTTFQKHAGKVSGGVQIHVTDAAAFRPVATFAALVALASRHDPEAFRFRTERYEYVDDVPAFDLLTGSAHAREAISRGDDARAIAEHVSRVDPAWPEVLAEARSRAARAAFR